MTRPGKACQYRYLGRRQLWAGEGMVRAACAPGRRFPPPQQPLSPPAAGLPAAGCCWLKDVKNRARGLSPSSANAASRRDPSLIRIFISCTLKHSFPFKCVLFV